MVPHTRVTSPHKIGDAVGTLHERKKYLEFISRKYTRLLKSVTRRVVCATHVGHNHGMDAWGFENLRLSFKTIFQMPLLEHFLEVILAS